MIHHRLRTASWLMAAIALGVAAALHGATWYVMSRHLHLSGALASALIALAILKHAGWLGGAYALRGRRRPPSQ